MKSDCLERVFPRSAWQAITAFAGFVTLASAAAAPADFWRLTVKSRQGEPLRAIATLGSLPQEHLSTSCLSLGSERDAPGSDMPFLRTASLRLNSARKAVEISTVEPITTPALSLVLRVQCAGGPLHARHFAALIPPAVIKASPPGANASQPIRLGFHLRLAQDDSVAGIAQVLFPGQRAQQQDLVGQVIAGNPDVFPDKLDRNVPANTVLWFPDLAGFRQSVSSHGRVPSVASAPGSSTAHGSTAARARSPTIQATVTAKPQPVATVPETPRLAAPVGLEDKTRALESGVNAMRSQCASLESHLQRIEQSVEALKGVVAAMPVPSRLSAIQCPSAVPPPAPQIRVVTEPIPWTVWVGLPALGVALAAALFALWRTGVLMRRRAAEPVGESDDRPTVPAVKARERARDPGSTSHPGTESAPVRAVPKRAQSDDTERSGNGNASRAEVSVDILMEMERAIDGTRSIFTDVDRLIGLGRTESAIGMLQFEIKENPMDRDCWIKLMAIYRREGRKAEFDAIAAEFKKKFPNEGLS